MLTGTHAAAANAVMKARSDVGDKWNAIADAQKTPLSAGQIAQATAEVEAEALKALFAHIVAHLQITILPTAVGLQTGVASGPTLGPAAPVPLPPGSIT